MKCYKINYDFRHPTSEYDYKINHIIVEYEDTSSECNNHQYIINRLISIVNSDMDWVLKKIKDYESFIYNRERLRRIVGNESLKVVNNAFELLQVVKNYLMENPDKWEYYHDIDEDIRYLGVEAHWIKSRMGKYFDDMGVVIKPQINYKHLLIRRDNMKNLLKNLENLVV